MTSQFANYIPVQGLPAGVSDLISAVEGLSESVTVDNEGTANSSETMSESVVVTVT